MKVYVYFNLHKKLFSVKALEGEKKGLVIAHRETLLLRDVKPKVSEAGRQRVLQEQRKNVHAGMTGDWDPDFEILELQDTKNFKDVTYNPYKYSTFVYKENEEEYVGSDVALLHKKQIFVS